MASSSMHQRAPIGIQGEASGTSMAKCTSRNFHFCALEIKVFLAYRISGKGNDVHKRNGSKVKQKESVEGRLSETPRSQTSRRVNLEEAMLLRQRKKKTKKNTGRRALEVPHNAESIQIRWLFGMERVILFT